MATKGKGTRKAGTAARAVARVAAGGRRELIVLARPEAGLRALPGEPVGASTPAAASALNAVLAAHGATLTPLFGASETRARRGMPAAQGGPDLGAYYTVRADDDKLDALAISLQALDSVEAAYVKPAGEAPVYRDSGAAPLADEAPPTTPDYNGRQGYLDPAPGGIDARYAWTRPGGRGAGVRVIDLEWAWRYSHEDLLQNQGGVVAGTNGADDNHGTAVLGEISADVNGQGVTGISPDAVVSSVSFSLPTAMAIRQAADRLRAGDIMLLEIHRAGPRFNFQARADQAGYIAIEWWPDDFAAILYASGRGVIVVEAAGNGAQNLDDAIYGTRPAGFPAVWRNPFNRANPQCGAIIVGAGAPPPGTHGRNWGPDRSRLDFSNFGACVDVQGWGREVTTTGYGDLQGGANRDLWYTDTFSGTSSASPIVTGALASLQGALRAANRTLLTPATARNLLRTTGSPQQDAPGRPASQRIGNRPNLRQALDRLFGKTRVKDVLDNKIWIKEMAKEGKELKEAVKEFKELKEQKEKEKELKEFKEFKEFKETRENFGNLGDLIRTPEAEAGRIDQLEQAVVELAHFIGADLRPDLQASALSHEDDLTALSASLQQTADLAQRAKDEKDAEKVMEN